MMIYRAFEHLCDGFEPNALTVNRLATARQMLRIAGYLLFWSSKGCTSLRRLVESSFWGGNRSLTKGTALYVADS
eukprot:scaffold78239_cov46-Attheya_sp.AAC.1